MIRFYVLALSLLLAGTSCNSGKPENKDKTDDKSNTNINSASSKDVTEASGNSDNFSEEPMNSENKNSTISSGQYMKKDKPKDGCNCYCLEVNFSGNSELCLDEDKMYIQARFSKTENNNIKVYYIAPSGRNQNGELPWEDFQQDLPIAVLSPDDNGNFILDWKGFSIDGKLAVDYAIFGKKTLEGSYQKTK